MSIYSRSEFAYAAVFAETFRQHHPDTALTMLLLDGHNQTDPESQAPFAAADVQTLALSDILENSHRRFLTEIWDRESLRVVCIPFLLDTLLDRYDQLVHLPVRTRFFDSCIDLFDGLEHGSFSLAPTVPLAALMESVGEPGQALFRLDYAAVRSDTAARRWLRRWQHFIARDQVLNFVHANASALTEGFVPLPETASYNTRSDETYRQFTLGTGRQLMVDGEPVRSFTFAGSWLPERAAADIGQVPMRVIHRSYASELIDHDLHATRHRTYGHDFSTDGTFISPLFREIMREHADTYRQVGSPTSLLEYIVTSSAGAVPLAQSIWNRRTDLRDQFHSIDDPAYAAWLTSEGDRELGLKWHHVAP